MRSSARIGQLEYTCSRHKCRIFYFKKITWVIIWKHKIKSLYEHFRDIGKRINAIFPVLWIKIWICTAVNVCNGTLSTPLMVVTKPRLSLVSSVSLYQLTYLYRTYFWAFIHEICVSKESNIIKDILLDNKKN